MDIFEQAPLLFREALYSAGPAPSQHRQQLRPWPCRGVGHSQLKRVKELKYMKTWNVLLVALLVISPLASAVAQGGTGPELKADSTKEANDVKNGSATKPPQSSSAASTVSPGSDSTAASDRHGTDPARSGAAGSGK